MMAQKLNLKIGYRADNKQFVDSILSLNNADVCRNASNALVRCKSVPFDRDVLIDNLKGKTQNNQFKAYFDVLGTSVSKRNISDVPPEELQEYVKKREYPEKFVQDVIPTYQGFDTNGRLMYFYINSGGVCSGNDFPVSASGTDGSIICMMNNSPNQLCPIIDNIAPTNPKGKTVNKTENGIIVDCEYNIDQSKMGPNQFIAFKSVFTNDEKTNNTFSTNIVEENSTSFNQFAETFDGCLENPCTRDIVQIPPQNRWVQFARSTIGIFSILGFLLFSMILLIVVIVIYVKKRNRNRQIQNYMSQIPSSLSNPSYASYRQ